MVYSQWRWWTGVLWCDGKKCFKERKTAKSSRMIALYFLSALVSIRNSIATGHLRTSKNCFKFSLTAFSDASTMILAIAFEWGWWRMVALTRANLAAGKAEWHLVDNSVIFVWILVALWRVWTLAWSGGSSRSCLAGCVDRLYLWAQENHSLLWPWIQGA